MSLVEWCRWAGPSRSFFVLAPATLTPVRTPTSTPDLVESLLGSQQEAVASARRVLEQRRANMVKKEPTCSRTVPSEVSLLGHARGTSHTTTRPLPYHAVVRSGR